MKKFIYLTYKITFTEQQQGTLETQYYFDDNKDVYLVEVSNRLLPN